MGRVALVVDRETLPVDRLARRSKTREVPLPGRGRPDGAFVLRPFAEADGIAAPAGQPGLESPMLSGGIKTVVQACVTTL